MAARHPERIVCLTEETTETLYLLGEERRIVGISGYTVRPPRARREKPRVSAFLSAKNEAILKLKPDQVQGVSDQQAVENSGASAASHCPFGTDSSPARYTSEQ